MRLANRRFVPFYFDLGQNAPASDADARQFVVAARKELGGAGVPTPPLLFMNAKGEVLGQASNYATPDQVLEAMLAVLRGHPQYNQPGAAEKKVASAIDGAEIQIDLQNLDSARKILEADGGSRAHYLLGRLARFRRDWADMEKHFAQVAPGEWRDDLRMERAFRLWAEGDFAKLRVHLDSFPKASPRYTEARYYLGLAHFHLKDKDKALATWKETITACGQDPWNYRADWAYTEVATGPQRVFSTAGKRQSLLNRIGYMGRGNPDLRPPK